jgi:hypothetical protein
MGSTDMQEKLYSENLHGRRHLKDLSVDMRVNLKLMLKKLDVAI